MTVPGQLITAVDMAIASGIDPKRFRAALRAGLGWHPHNGRWEVLSGSSQHQDIEMVMVRRCGGGSNLRLDHHQNVSLNGTGITEKLRELMLHGGFKRS